MATVKIWKVENNLKRVIEYTEDGNKTSQNKNRDLDNALNYIENNNKTQEKLYVTAINCSVDNALEEMTKVKKMFRKTSGIIAFHAEQSFKEGEVTPEQAHSIGVELANELWGDRFQVVVSTHLNTAHYHNHFVINSVSFIDGKKYYGNRSTYADFRHLSNIICQEHGLSTLEEKTTKKGINYRYYQNRDITYKNYYRRAKEDLDLAITIASNYKDFLHILSNMGYSYTVRSGKLSIRGENYKRNIRIERYFGEDYSIQNISKQIKGEYLSTTRIHYKNENKVQNYYKDLKTYKSNSFFALYIKYCNMLSNYPEQIKSGYLSPKIRDDVQNLDNISNQAILLASNKIETESDFFDFYKNREQALIKLTEKKKEFYNFDDEKYIELIKEMEIVKRDLTMCDEIHLRKKSVFENLKEIQEKEMIKNEYIK